MHAIAVSSTDRIHIALLASRADEGRPSLYLSVCTNDQPMIRDRLQSHHSAAASSAVRLHASCLYLSPTPHAASPHPHIVPIAISSAATAAVAGTVGLSVPSPALRTQCMACRSSMAIYERSVYTARSTSHAANRLPEMAITPAGSVRTDFACGQPLSREYLPIYGSASHPDDEELSAYQRRTNLRARRPKEGSW